MAGQAAFATKFGLPFPLLADTGGAIAKAYGVAGGLLRAGLPKRESFLIGPDGRLLRHWPRVDPARHAVDVLEALRAVAPATS